MQQHILHKPATEILTDIASCQYDWQTWPKGPDLGDESIAWFVGQSKVHYCGG